MSTPPTTSSITTSLNPNHLGDDDEEGEIHGLLLKLSHVAKQRLELGEQKLLQAKRRDQEYIDFCKRYTATQQKLSIIFSEIQKQLGVIKRLVLSLGAKNRTLLGEIEKFRQFQEQCISDLRVVLDDLHKIPLHPQLISSSSQTTSTNINTTTASSSSSSLSTSIPQQDKRTLFDFVNIESVTDLQQRADNELIEMRNIESLGITILQQVDDQFREISQSSSRLFDSNEEDLAPTSRSRGSEGLQLQPIVLDVTLNNNEIKAMGNIVLEIAGHYDRLKHVLSNPVFSSTIDTEELEERTNTLSQTLPQLDVLLGRVNTNCTHIQSRYRRFSDFYRSAVSCYQELEKMAPNIPSKVVQIDELQTVFHQRRMNSDVIFEEIRDLSLWYTLFQTAYEKMLYEIDRRRFTQEQHQSRVDDIKSELLKMYEDEESRRQQFFDDYGKYLPVSLCPSIMEKTTKYTVNPENFNSNLPDIVIPQRQLPDEVHPNDDNNKNNDDDDDNNKIRMAGHGGSGSHHQEQ